MTDARPLAVFDLDGTLLQDRTVLHLARRFGVEPEVRAIWDRSRQQELAAGEEESRAIAALYAGLDVSEFERACAELPFRHDTRRTIEGLRAHGFRIGVVSASYRYATRHAQDALGLDFEVGVDLDVRDGKLTGTIGPSAYPGPCRQFVCKEAALDEWAQRTHAPVTLAVGDGRNDICMIRRADLGVAIEPCVDAVRKAADVVVRDLGDILAHLPEALAGR